MQIDQLFTCKIQSKMIASKSTVFDRIRLVNVLILMVTYAHNYEFMTYYYYCYCYLSSKIREI